MVIVKERRRLRRGCRYSRCWGRRYLSQVSVMPGSKPCRPGRQTGICRTDGNPAMVVWSQGTVETGRRSRISTDGRDSTEIGVGWPMPGLCATSEKVSPVTKPHRRRRHVGKM